MAIFIPGAQQKLGAKDRPQHNIPTQINLFVVNELYRSTCAVFNALDPKGPQLDFKTSPKVR